VGARRKTRQKPAVVEPVEIPDAEHELVIERAAAIDVAKAAGKVCPAARQVRAAVYPSVGRGRAHRHHHRTGRAAGEAGH
jgi:hypothetical protein